MRTSSDASIRARIAKRAHPNESSFDQRRRHNFAFSRPDRSQEASVALDVVNKVTINDGARAIPW